VSKYINLETAGESTLSRTACALLLPLTLLSNKDNEIDKKEFIRIVSWIKDYRTWDKYWTELVEKGVLIQVDKDIWMVSPHECYADGVSHTTLINKWNEVRNAIN
tara:strand:- start:243 stop:557 length:315 start_codon:yes stop_codon:yes gene_type:complete